MATDSPAAPVAKPAPLRPLRIWPAVLLVVLMWGFRLAPQFSEVVPMTLTLLSVMMPGFLGLVVLLWWVAFSRANGTERILGLLGVMVIGVVTWFTQDRSFVPMGYIIFPIPVGISLFALAAILLPRYSGRTNVMLVAFLIGCGFWCLVRIDGIWGDFHTTRSWRWEPTAEDEFLATLASQPKADPAAIETKVPEPEWPGLRGPDRRGIQTGIVLDEDWKKNPPKEIWRIRIGPGWSSFAVAGDRLFTQEQRGENESVVCYQSETGREIWSYDYPSRFWEAVAGAGPRATPTITNEAVFALGAEGVLMRLDPTKGDLVWKRDLKDDAKREPPTWGFSSSPLLVDDLVVVHAGGKDKLGVMAYDQASGDLKWTAKSGDHSYSSPQLAEVDGKKGILMISNSGLDFLSIQDGSVIWQHEWEFGGYRVLQPLQVDGNSFLISTGMENGTRRVKVEASDGQFSTSEVWTSRSMKPDYNDFVPYDGHLYGFDRNIFASVDLKTGKRNWKKGRYGNGQVLLLQDAGQLLVLSEQGDVVLLKATPEKWDERAKLSVLSGKTWNHPVLVGNRLYVRNGEEAVCLEVKLKEAKEETKAKEGKSKEEG